MKRASANKDQRTKSVCNFGARRPELGKGAESALPFCNSQTMSLHLIEISPTVATRSHAVALVDHAGWHNTNKLNVPENITLIPLPSNAPN